MQIVQDIVLTIMAGLVIYALYIGTADADGPIKQVGDTLTYTCTPPTTYADGTALPSDIQITMTAYATQNPPQRGEPLGQGAGCPLSVSSEGMATGQWYGYLTATGGGRPESALSNAAPFVLAPAASVPLSAPADLQVQ